jgi:hypothetical protein
VSVERPDVVVPVIELFLTDAAVGPV